MDTIYEGLVTWIMNALTDVADWISAAFFSIFNLDASSFYLVFPILKSAYQIFIYLGFVLVIVIVFSRLAMNLLVPATDNYEDPLKLAMRLVVAFFCVAYAHDISHWIQTIFSGAYNALDSTLKGKVPDKAFEGTKISDIDWGKVAKVITDTGSGVAVKIACIILLFILLRDFMRLMFVGIERYTVLSLSYLFAPLAFSTVASKSTEKIAASYLRMILSTTLLMMFNLIFLRGGVYAIELLSISNSQNVTGAWGAGKNGFSSAYVVAWFLLVMAFLNVGQRMDQYLKSLGLDVAQTGGALMSDVRGGLLASMAAVRTISSAARGMSGSFSRLTGGGRSSGGGGGFGGASTSTAGNGGFGGPKGPGGGPVGAAISFGQRMRTQTTANNGAKAGGIAAAVQSQKAIESGMIPSTITKDGFTSLARGAVSPALGQKANGISSATFQQMGNRNGFVARDANGRQMEFRSGQLKPSDRGTISGSSGGWIPVDNAKDPSKVAGWMKAQNGFGAAEKMPLNAGAAFGGQSINGFASTGALSGAGVPKSVLNNPNASIRSLGNGNFAVSEPMTNKNGQFVNSKGETVGSLAEAGQRNVGTLTYSGEKSGLNMSNIKQGADDYGNQFGFIPHADTANLSQALAQNYSADHDASDALAGAVGAVGMAGITNDNSGLVNIGDATGNTERYVTASDGSSINVPDNNYVSAGTLKDALYMAGTDDPFNGDPELAEQIYRQDHNLTSDDGIASIDLSHDNDTGQDYVNVEWTNGYKDSISSLDVGTYAETVEERNDDGMYMFEGHDNRDVIAASDAYVGVGDLMDKDAYQQATGANPVSFSLDDDKNMIEVQNDDNTVVTMRDQSSYIGGAKGVVTTSDGEGWVVDDPSKNERTRPLSDSGTENHR